MDAARGSNSTGRNNSSESTTPTVRRQRTLAWWKKPLFSLLATTLVFGAVEGVLTLCDVRPLIETSDPFVGFESTLPLFRERTTAEGHVVLETSQAKLAYFNAQQFSKKKPAGTYRVFCLGGSTTYGRPYDHRTSFPGWLQELLPAVDDRHTWEVINAGGVSYASYRVTLVMEELAEFEPDLFIVYSAHNEFLEDRTYQDVRDAPPLVRRATALLARTRTTALMHAWYHGHPVRDDLAILPDEVDEAMNHTVGPTAYHRDDTLRDRILEHYRLNLQRMVNIAIESGAKLVLVGPAANVKDCSPFKSQHRDDLADEEQRRWTDSYKRAVSLADGGEFERSLRAFQAAEAIDDRHAGLHFRTGQVLFNLRRFPAARSAFDRAIEEDVCPLRAGKRIRQAVLQVAERNQVPLVDFSTVAVNRCLHAGHNCPGKEVFLDHVHPTIEAHRLLAEAIVETLIDEAIVTASSSWKDDVEQPVSRRVLSGVDHRAHAAALRNLAKVLNWAGKHHEAGPLAIEAVRLGEREGQADDPEALFLAAVYLAAVGQPDPSIAFFERSLQCRPDHADAHYRLGDVLAGVGKLPAARNHFLQVVKFRPGDANAHQKVGAVSALMKDYQRALKYYRLADELKPNDPRLAFNMALALEHLGKTGDAIRWYATALGLNETDAGAHNRLGVLLLKTGERDEARDHFQQALRLNPDLDEARQNLDALRGTSAN